MNIQIFINFLFTPFWWIIKIIIEHYVQSKHIEFEEKKLLILQKEAKEQRAHELKLKDRDNEIRRIESEDKTKRLNMMLENQREIAMRKLEKQNPNSVAALSIMRKNKKGRKTK